VDMESPKNGTLSDFPVDQRSCQLLGPTALVVQALMGVLVILSLVFKRHREERKRPWRIWLFDVSKQVFGQMFVHGVNVLISDVGSHNSAGNACVYYFLNILIDTTLGVALIYVILRALTHILADRAHLKGFESGQYGNPPSFEFWLRQAAVYVLSLTSMKLLVVGLFAIYPGIFKIGDWLLSWTRTSNGEDAIQVIFTMGLFPIIMNILQFWLIDSIVKASQDSSVSLQSDPSRHSYEDGQREPLFGVPSDDEDGDDDAAVLPQHDIENPRTRSRSCDENKRSTPDEQKSIASRATTPGVSDGGTSVPMHSYPPGVDSAGTSTSSSRTDSTSPPPGEPSHKYKRSMPAPLRLQSAHHPAINSSDQPSTRPKPNPSSSISKTSVTKTIPESIPVAVDQAQNKDWASWDDSDDWANRVGEDDWTGKRIEHKKNELSEAWGPSFVPPQQQQPRVGAVGS